MTGAPLPGMCSIALRTHRPDEIVALAAACGLGGIEWGADVHAPPGDTARAEKIRRWCDDGGVACASYGSYLFAGTSTAGEAEAVADTAEALGAPNVRIWTPLGVTPDAPAADRAKVCDGVVELGAVIVGRGFTASLEFHTNTLTHTAASTNALLDAAGIDGLGTYWQPDFSLPTDALVCEYEAVAPRVTNLHVFAWATYEDRYPLARGDALWPQIFARARRGWALIEHVVGDSPEQVQADAATLRRWLEETE